MTTYLFIDGGYLQRNYADSVRPWFGTDGEIDFQQVKGVLVPNARSITTHYTTDSERVKAKKNVKCA